MPHADSTLPEDPAALAAMIAALRGELAEERVARRIAELGLQAKTLEAERLRVQIARLRHERFGRSSERLAVEVEQLELRLDEVLADIAASGGADDAEDEAASAKTPEEKARRRGRKPLPDSLPRRDVEHLPAEGCTWRACGGALRQVGEDVSWPPIFGQFAGLAKLGPGCCQAANRIVSLAPYASSGVCPPRAEWGLSAL
jgi:hypothetical protein